MKTVYDLVRNASTLELTCRNCSHVGTVNRRFLTRKHGQHTAIDDLPFKCTNCRQTQLTWREVPDDRCKPKPLKMTYFGGVYAKDQD